MEEQVPDQELIQDPGDPHPKTEKAERVAQGCMSLAGSGQRKGACPSQPGNLAALHLTQHPLFVNGETEAQRGAGM